MCNKIAFLSLILVPQLTVVVDYSTPLVDSPFTANCTVGFSPGVPREAVVVDFLGLDGSPPFDSSTTTQINETHIVIESVVRSVQFYDRLEYICRARVDGPYIYTRQDSNVIINILLRRESYTNTL